jgi:hypothetical protein
VITAAALCAGPPLLVPGLSGADPAAAELRAASRTAVAGLVATAPDLVAVVGPAERDAVWPATARPDLARYGGARPDLARYGGARPDLARSGAVENGASPVAPLSVGLGALLLDDAGYAGPLLLRTVGEQATLAQCQAVAAEVVAAAARVGLLVIADGSARRTLKAPGYFDQRAEQYDEQVHQAVATGELSALQALDPVLARELMAPGWPALQVLAAAFGVHRPQSTVHYGGAPYGVGYLVATITPRST